MVGIFLDQHVSEKRLARQAAGHDVLRCQRLGNAVAA